jgi:hypothetical protein
MGRMGRGGSHTEPTAFDPANITTRPRMFVSKLSAQRALSSWLRGKVHHSSGYDSYCGEYYESSSIEKVPSRVKADMEIVETSLVLP